MDTEQLLKNKVDDLEKELVLVTKAYNKLKDTYELEHTMLEGLIDMYKETKNNNIKLEAQMELIQKNFLDSLT